MAPGQFRNASEKLCRARGALMLPLRPEGEAQAFADAFTECSWGLHNVGPDDLDERAQSWLRTIQEAMDTTGIEDPFGRGKFDIKAERLTFDQKQEFSHAVDELASWFDRKFWAG